MGINELYNSIVDDVLENVKESFLDEGYDEQILKSLRDSWLSKIRDAQQPRTQQLRTQNQNQNQNQHQQPTSQAPQAPPPTSQPASVIVSNNNNNNNINNSDNNHSKTIPQLDGSSDTSDSSDDDDILDDDDDDDDDMENSDEERESESTHDDEDPLNSGDDVSNDESSEMFETDNVVVCQYDKITRNRNKWKFHLKDGIMNVNGKDYVFQKAVGDAEW